MSANSRVTSASAASGFGAISNAMACARWLPREAGLLAKADVVRPVGGAGLHRLAPGVPPQHAAILAISVDHDAMLCPHRGQDANRDRPIGSDLTLHVGEQNGRW